MKKFFAMMVMAIAVSLSFTSCWTQGGVDDWGKVSPLTDNGSELRWTYNAVAAEITYIYGYEGNQITSHTEILKYGSKLLAKAAYSEYEDNENGIEASLSGKTMTLVYPKSYYEDMTVEDVKQEYETMKEINNEAWE